MTRWTVLRQLERAAAVGGAAVVAVLLAAAAGLLAVGRAPDDSELRAVAVGVALALIAAAVFVPARAAAEEISRRLRRDDRRDPAEVVASFGDRISRGAPIDELLLLLTESLRRSLHLRQAQIWVLDGLELRLVASVPASTETGRVVTPDEVAALGRATVAGEAWLDLWAPSLLGAREPGRTRVAPARHGGTVLGVLAVDRDLNAVPFTEREDRALGDLGSRLGDLLRNRQLDSALRQTLEDLRAANRELQASRARLVAAADAERQRIERDLHDGAQQHLVALAVNLRLASDALDDDQVAAREALTALAADVRVAVEEVRDLARGIYPPLLAESGLGDALRAVARRSPQAVTVEVAALPRAPAGIEAAIYFCCLEALQNAAKHAPEASVRVVLSQAEDAIAFTVVDDGPGFDPGGAPGGSGLQGMLDRVGAIGGSLTISSTPGGGTTIAGSVPVSSGSAAS